SALTSMPGTPTRRVSGAAAVSAARADPTSESVRAMASRRANGLMARSLSPSPRGTRRPERTAEEVWSKRERRSSARAASHAAGGTRPDQRRERRGADRDHGARLDAREDRGRGHGQLDLEHPRARREPQRPRGLGELGRQGREPRVGVPNDGQQAVEEERREGG